jgi:uncharacterized protein (DUF1800 family)
MTILSSPRPTPSRLDELLPRRPRRAAVDLPSCRAPTSEARVPGPFLGSRGWLARLVGGGAGRPEPAPRRDPLLALVQRVTQGFTGTELARAEALGHEAYLEEQLAPFALDDAAMNARLAGYTTLDMGPRELFERYAEDFSEPYFQLKGAMLLRAVHSRRQLQERMCEFWNDHFSIHHDKGDIVWALLPENERLVTRPHALGSFPAMLSASAHGGAMLYYLDNWLNARGAPQENYARELLELHTLGLRGGYSEADVREVAKCFTGWTLGSGFNSTTWLRGVFEPSLHAPGPKFVLGHEIPNFPPREDAQRVLDVAAAHPGTARFLAAKLLRWLLTPSPSPELVERVAAEYLATQGDVPAVLRVILARANLGTTGALRPKFRRPVHFVVALLRALGAEVTDPLYLVLSLYSTGHVPFDHVQPDGYPDTVEAWGHSLLPRWRFANELLLSAGPGAPPFPGVSLAYAALAERLEFGGPGDRRGLAARIDERLLGRSLSPLEREALQEYVDGFTSPFGPNALLETIALGASLPGFQWY